MLHLPVPVRVPKEGRQQRNTCEGSPTPAKGQQEQWLIGFKCHNSKLVMEKLHVKLKEAEEKEVGTYKRKRAQKRNKSLINVVSANQAQWWALYSDTSDFNTQCIYWYTKTSIFKLVLDCALYEILYKVYITHT